MVFTNQKLLLGVVIFLIISCNTNNPVATRESTEEPLEFSPQTRSSHHPVENNKKQDHGNKVQASYYGGGDGFEGKKTASGERFNAQELTAAHKTLPFGTKVEVKNPKNNKKVTVRINDRGPYAKGKSLDLSKGAAEQIGMDGTEKVEMKVVEKPAQ